MCSERGWKIIVFSSLVCIEFQMTNEQCTTVAKVANCVTIMPNYCMPFSLCCEQEAIFSKSLVSDASFWRSSCLLGFGNGHLLLQQVLFFYIEDESQPVEDRRDVFEYFGNFTRQVLDYCFVSQGASKALKTVRAVSFMRCFCHAEAAKIVPQELDIMSMQIIITHICVYTVLCRSQTY